MYINKHFNLLAQIKCLFPSHASNQIGSLTSKLKKMCKFKSDQKRAAKSHKNTKACCVGLRAITYYVGHVYQANV